MMIEKKGLGRKGEDLELLICRCASILAFIPLSIGVCVCVCVCVCKRERKRVKGYCESV